LIEARSNDPALETRVMDVASKFICACGTCGEQPLDVCSCNVAVQERQLIRSSLQSGQSPEQVVSVVNKNFGWMKPGFAAKYDSTGRKTRQPNTATPPARIRDSRKLQVPDQQEVGSSQFPLKKTVATKIATAADRVEIFSNFKCLCGQCRIEELKDCGSGHPRGATEVKAFVDQKIRARKYAVAQLIDEVEKTYGGRKY
jgi:hypothetical protein